MDATTSSLRRRLRALPSGTSIGWSAAVAIPVAWAMIAGLWTPRGPLTTGEVLAAMVIGALVGFVAGLACASRWAMLASPMVFVIVFEVMRIGHSGPTVDAPAFSLYGTFAFVVGRGFHGLVGLAPMVLGAAFGAGAEHAGRQAQATRQPQATSPPKPTRRAHKPSTHRAHRPVGRRSAESSRSQPR